MGDNLKKSKIDYLYYVKLLMLGNSGVGKSSILSRFTDNKFPLNLMGTAGIDFKNKNIEIDEKRIKLEIFDTAGQERYHCITTNYYQGVMGIILVYDVTDKISFDDVNKWISQIKDNVGDDVIIFLIGNKIDKKDEKIISFEQGNKFAQKNAVFFAETSAKEADNIDEIFQILVRDILKNEKILCKYYENAKKLQLAQPNSLPLNIKSFENKNLLEENNGKSCRSKCCF